MPEVKGIPPRRDLLRSSRRYGLKRHLYSYEWMSDQVILGYGPQANIYKMVLYDTRTHQETVLSSLNRAMGTRPNNFRLSPDRRRLVWGDDSMFETKYIFHSALLDGSDHCTWDVGRCMTGKAAITPHWLADGSGWVTITRTAGSNEIEVILAKLANPGKLQVVRLGVPEPMAAGRGDNGALLLGGSGGNRILGVGLRQLWTGLGNQGRSFSLFELDAAVGKRSLRWWEMPVEGASWAKGPVAGAAYSSRSKRIAWLTNSDCYCNGKEPARSWLCTSRLDGSDLRILGEVDEMLHEAGLRWLPGGRAVSFIGSDLVPGAPSVWVTSDR